MKNKIGMGVALGRLVCGLVCVAALSCSSKSEQPPAPAQGAVAPPAKAKPAIDAPAPSPAPVPTPALAATPEPVGFDGLPAAVSAEANALNSKALKAHGKGDFETSRAGFEAAVKASPGFLLARYNMVCALSRLGRLDEAASELGALFALDLPRFKPRLTEDSDLAALAASPQGKTLLARADELEKSWRYALENGIPTVTSSPVRAGVWVQAWKRFVPMGPPVSGAVSAVLAGDKVLTVAAKSEEGTSLLMLGNARIVVATAPLGPVQLEKKLSKTDESYATMEIGFTSGGIRFHVAPPDGASSWTDIATPGGAESKTGGAPPSPRLVITPNGTKLAAEPPAGFKKEKNALVTPAGGEPIQLGSGHAASSYTTIVVSPDGTIAVVASVRSDCPMEAMGGVFKHFVDRVNLTTKAVERLSEAGSSAEAIIGPDGALYLQIGDRIRRYASPADASYEELPVGIQLAAPLSAQMCGA